MKNNAIPSSLRDNIQAPGQPPGVRPFKQVFWLAVLGLAAVPLLSGCLTGWAVSPTAGSKPFPDYVDKVDKAALTDRNQLTILFEGRLYDPRRRGAYTRAPYMIAVPLSQVAIQPYPVSASPKVEIRLYPKSAVDTSALFIYGAFEVCRAEIIEGWGVTNGGPTAANRRYPPIGAPITPVPIGAPIVAKLHHVVHTNGFTLYRVVPVGAPISPELREGLFDERDNYPLLPGATRALYQVINTETNLVMWPRLPDFVYVDTSRPEAFTEIRIQPNTIFLPPKWRRCLVPLTVAGDVALSPLYLLFAIASGHCW